MKFDRAYSLSLEVVGGENITVNLPYTIEFTITRKALASSQTATIIIYNLNEALRDQIYKDRFNFTEFRAIQLRAGYVSLGIPLVFNGTIYQAYSERQGVNFKTVIECFDGAYGISNSFSSVTLGAGQTFSDIIAQLNTDLKGVTGSPIIGSFTKRTLRTSTYVGNTWQRIVQLSSGLATIDNGQLKVLNQNEVIQAEIPIITSDSGLLGVPRRMNTMIEMPLLFEPRLTLGQLVALQSVGNSLYNGSYKVAGFVHKGIISPTVNGDYSTQVSLWKGTSTFLPVTGKAVQ